MSKVYSFLFVLFFLLQINMFAQSVNFTEPNANQVYTISSGTTMDITARWNFSYDFGSTSSYYLSLITENGSYSPLTGNSYTVHNVAAGPKTWTIELYVTDTSFNSYYANSTVHFSVVPGHYSIIADNNFIDNTGNGTRGQIKVDDTTRIAPYSFSRFSGQNVSLTAVTPQTDNGGYQRIWHTGSYQPSRWHKNGENINSYNQTHNITVSINEDGMTL